MMENQIQISCQEIKRAEYMQAGMETIRRMLLPLLGMVAILTLIICLVIADFSLRSILPPFLVVGAGIGIYWVLLARNWKDFPAETAFSYTIDQEGWQITLGEDTVSIPWDATARMTKRRDVIFLYNEGDRSNLLPRRCLTKEQLAQIEAWFRASRTEYRELQKLRDARERARYRTRLEQNRSRRRFGRNGRSNHL